MRQTVGEFLIRRLSEVGVRHIFGVPGDYNLALMQQLEDAGEPEWVGCCNELNAAYAADGYGRIAGLSALIVTYGVGALSAINGVAGAYAEHVPVVCVCGSLPRRAIAQGKTMHHTLGEDGKGDFSRAFAEVTAAQARLTPANAAGEIDRLIVTAWREKRPVYLEAPSDIVYLDIETPNAPLVLRAAEPDPERLATCVRLVTRRLDEARAPALLIDMDAARYGVAADLALLAQARGLPFATMAGAKSVLDESSPRFLGEYAGAAGRSDVRAAIEESDCLLAIGHRRVDATSGFFTDHVPASAIHIEGDHIDAGEEHFEAVPIAALLRALAAASAPEPPPPAPTNPARTPVAGSGVQNGPLTQDAFWAAVGRFIRQGDVIVAEDGTSSAGIGGLRLPDGCTVVVQPIWGSIGFSMGCLLGTLKAAPDRRHLLFIGDGSFQLTAQELSTILRHDLAPRVFLLNNRGYTIERTILGRTARYNDVADWDYAALPTVFARRALDSRVIETLEQLEQALNSDEDAFRFFECVMAPDDAPAGLILGGHASAELDNGPRGPQSRPGIQIEARPRST